MERDNGINSKSRVEYIEREAAIRICERLRDKTENDDMAFALNWAKQSIDAIPAADVVPVRYGRWKPVVDRHGNQEESEWYGDLYYCDKCNWTMIEKSHYCPNCGANMKDGYEE